MPLPYISKYLASYQTYSFEGSKKTAEALIHNWTKLIRDPEEVNKRKGKNKKQRKVKKENKKQKNKKNREK